jgi:hypothetical protein
VEKKAAEARQSLLYMYMESALFFPLLFFHNICNLGATDPPKGLRLQMLLGGTE